MIESPRRRLLAVLVSLAVVATPATASASSASAARPAQTEAPGAGQGIAELIQVDPAIANLALTMRVGTSLAGHQNLGATSEARTVDLGFIGSILTSEGCDGGDPTIPPSAIPEIVSASSANPEDADGSSSDVAGLVSAFVQADSVPSSKAMSRLEPLGLPGLVDVIGGRTEVTSTADGHRTVAVSEIARLDIAGGVISIRGMRWEAVRQLEPAVTTTQFDAAKLFVAGAEIPLPAGDVLPAIEQALAPVLDGAGIELSFPQQVEIPDGIALTPLSVGVVPGEVRDGILGPIFEAVQPARSSLADFLLDLDCGNSTYVTVLDVVLGAVSGAGFAAVRVGGVQADARTIELTSFLGGSPAPAQPSLTDPSTGVPTSADPVTSPQIPAPTSTSPSTTVAPLEPAGNERALGPITIPGTRGGPLVLIGLLGFTLAALAAGRDRYLMRKAQRGGPMNLS
ncbi:hypothetical protein [Actinospongicola halichondriae]|uniref:hypothetical protein n=1 Tax=Actinospongicola halichondriae TaxID=3236844 RepID=UPI003D4E7993